MSLKPTELEKILKMVVDLGVVGPASLDDMKQEYGISTATANRWLKEARHLGVRIACDRSLDGPPQYVVVNWDQIGPKAQKWLQLEEQQRQLLEEA